MSRDEPVDELPDKFEYDPENPTLIKPDNVYEFRISLWETSNLFKAGHRISLEVSGSNFQRFDRNLNTGIEVATDTEIRITCQTVLHNAQYASHLILPIILCP